jgi:hypothetical protein
MFVGTAWSMMMTSFMKFEFPLPFVWWRQCLDRDYLRVSWLISFT